MVASTGGSLYGELMECMAGLRARVMGRSRRKLRVGDWVEVRSREEILKTLDDKAQLDGMPFMPEMLAFCGKQFRVYKRAHKTCDTVFPIRGRRVERSVHLETRCNGQGHGGCQAACLIFWKEAWLKPIGSSKMNQSSAVELTSLQTEELVWAGAQRRDQNDGATVYVCQATRLPYATTPLAWWDIRQYFEDYASGNIGLARIWSGLVYSIYFHLSQAGIGLGRPMRWFYDKFHSLWHGTVFPRTNGLIPVGQPTPSETLDLQRGELVRVKSHAEIRKTITTDNRNRGMYWDAEMLPYCGSTYRVLDRVTRIIDEKTGGLYEMKNPGIILDSVFCQARYSACRMFCPRSIYPYWREIWLERVGSTARDMRSGAPLAQRQEDGHEALVGSRRPRFD